MYYTTRALVLREARYKEADKILTVLTKDEGKLTLRARGAVRRGSRIAAATQLLTFSDMTLFGNKGRWTLDEAATIEEFRGLRARLPALALGAYFAELLETVSNEGEPDAAVLQLGLNSLYALSRALCPDGQIKAAFELRLMALTGYEPELTVCARCGAPVERAWFSPAGGAAYCADCRAMAPGAVRALLPETLAAMRHIVRAAPKRLFSFTLEGAAAQELGAACEAYLLAQLERGFASLDYWRKVKEP